MTLRRHQTAMRVLAHDIAAGASIRTIFASVTPGGGKSALPPILAETLIGHGFDALVWIVPRNSLRTQGEGDYLAWTTRTRIRAASNEGDPLRGRDGYVTTYQAVAANPELHAKALRGRRYILFLDEPHHVSDGGGWHEALAPLIDRASLVVYASGTFARGDGKPIHGIPYGPDGLPDFAAAPHSTCITYSRSDALAEGAILPVRFRYLDGQAEWEKDGEVRSGSLSAGTESGDALFTALRTDYALQLLDETVDAWREHRSTAHPAGKLLVVAPQIAQAEVYRAHLTRRRIDSLIATSDDSASARESIARFKGQLAPSTDVLVTVAMAYEGLSVPAVSHIACLTHIRSIPWLEQCFARANRCAPGKVGGFIFGPDDPRYRAAIEAIDAEQVQALSDRSAVQQEATADNEAGEGGPGIMRIRPLSSQALGLDQAGLFDEDEPAPLHGGLADSEAEKLLRKEIARHIEIVVGARRPGSRGALERIIHTTLKRLAGDNPREALTVEELSVQWAELKARWPL